MDSVFRDSHHLEVIDEFRRRRGADTASFDRVAFTHRILEIVQPDNWTFALYQREGDFYTSRVRDLRRGMTAIWATVGIPPFASREEIAFVVAELIGKERAPYLLNLLSSAGALAE